MKFNQFRPVYLLTYFVQEKSIHIYSVTGINLKDYIVSGIAIKLTMDWHYIVLDLVRNLLERPRPWKAFRPFQVFATKFAAIAILKMLFTGNFHGHTILCRLWDTSADISQVHALADWANDHDM